MTHIGLGELVRRVRRDGVGGVSRRVIYELYHRSGASSLGRAIADADLVGASALDLPTLDGPAPADAKVGWVMAAPAAGSGGHTTLFRMIAGLRERGLSSVIFLYDARGGDLERHARVIREHWPWLDAEIRDARAGITGVAAAVASSWESAHVLAKYGTAPMARLYFVQDFEPFFHPRGSTYALAENTYRFGFRIIALGRMVHSLLLERGVASDLVPFGRDAQSYRFENRGDRSGVLFYVRRQNERRGYSLGTLALEEFHRRHPEQTIHTFGDTVSNWTVPVIDHGNLDPSQLNDLYNRVLGGLALSFTNVSLVPEEMLAAGAIPVVNDDPYARVELRHSHVVWAAPDPSALAEALCTVVEAPDARRRAAAAAGEEESASVSWSTVQDAVFAIISDELRGPVSRGAGAAISEVVGIGSSPVPPLQAAPTDDDHPLRERPT
ncbi:glycosyltransferase family 1 protein [Agromyces intestinalis]|uniref:rhamnosyltransferase WsaF family glycosyltransferase n=1 Tax=Agromyces intestinalis TaxID=2592652 RepID=UPI001AEFF07B|nr:glycosyltransferase family 1 protein [Agromyces intestinalis]